MQNCFDKRDLLISDDVSFLRFNFEEFFCFPDVSAFDSFFFRLNYYVKFLGTMMYMDDLK